MRDAADGVRACGGMGEKSVNQGRSVVPAATKVHRCRLHEPGLVRDFNPELASCYAYDSLYMDE